MEIIFALSKQSDNITRWKRGTSRPAIHYFLALTVPFLSNTSKNIFQNVGTEYFIASRLINSFNKMRRNVNLFYSRITYFGAIFSIFILPYALSRYDGRTPETTSERSLPTIQPDCDPHPAADLFYKHHSNRGYSYVHWLCREPFEQRLKICIEVFSKLTNREIRNNYRLMRHKGVEYECESRPVLYLKPIETSLEILMLGRDAKPEMCLNIDMYKCPLTKMDINFRGKGDPPEIYDFYITIGRSTVTIATLRDSPSGKNICLIDEYYYPRANRTYHPTSVMESGFMRFMS